MLNSVEKSNKMIFGYEVIVSKGENSMFHDCSIYNPDKESVAFFVKSARSNKEVFKEAATKIFLMMKRGMRGNLECAKTIHKEEIEKGIEVCIHDLDTAVTSHKYAVVITTKKLGRYYRLFTDSLEEAEAMVKEIANCKNIKEELKNNKQFRKYNFCFREAMEELGEYKDKNGFIYTNTERKDAIEEEAIKNLTRKEKRQIRKEAGISLVSEIIDSIKGFFSKLFKK